MLNVSREAITIGIHGMSHRGVSFRAPQGARKQKVLEFSQLRLGFRTPKILGLS